ncbi:MAG: HepT-like ribonuclease domain-containing protein [Cyanobacteriota bacterium]
MISLALAERLVPAAGLRSRLVHDDEAIDPRRVHAAIPVALRDLEELSAVLAARVAM